MTDGPDGWFWFWIVSMSLILYDIWKKGRYVPKRRHSRDEVAAPAVRSPRPPDAFMRARRAEHMRLASTLHYDRVPHLSRPPSGERLVLSMPVFLYESSENRLTRNLTLTARYLAADLVAAHPTGSGRPQSVVLMDRGTLMVTHRRILFTSPRRLREFPLDELSFFSTTRSSIALAARWRFGNFVLSGDWRDARSDSESMAKAKAGKHKIIRSTLPVETFGEIVNILKAAPILNRSQ